MADPSAFSNINALWGAVFARTLRALGATHAVVSPGSRCTPLLHALAGEPSLETTPVLDERTAAFYALGIAKATHRPVVLLCTSGTAAANYLPAVVEAWHAQVPLLVVTADRPAELQNCGAGQTIDQRHLYGTHAVWEAQAEAPENNPAALARWRDTVAECWRRALGPRPGPAHLNAPLRDPLAPSVRQPGFVPSEKISPDDFRPAPPTPENKDAVAASAILDWAKRFPRGVIVAGAAHPKNPDAYTGAVHRLARALGWPILADALNPLRHAASAETIWAYDALLRDPEVADPLRPDAVLQLGILPTSKTLRDWLARPAVPFLVLSPSGENLHPLHQPHEILAGDPATLDWSDPAVPPENFPAPGTGTGWLTRWRAAEAPASRRLADALENDLSLFEGKIAWLLARHLPDDTAVFFANSMPVRDAEYFWPANNSRRRVFSNRGANGIDGTLGTALGVAGGTGVPTVLLTGDLSLLHDSNAFLLAPEFSGSLTILLVNNRGGGIFQHLPVARDNAHFERFWATPQAVDFTRLAAAHGVPHRLVTTWEELRDALAARPARGIRILEIRTDRQNDAARRQMLLNG